MSEALYQPEGCKLLVRVKKIEEKTEGGLYKPDVVREKEKLGSTTGEVVAIGPNVILEFEGKTPEDRKLKIGDKIIFANYGGSIIDMDEVIRVLNDEDVLVRVK